jgi:hypothetical protein
MTVPKLSGIDPCTADFYPSVRANGRCVRIVGQILAQSFQMLGSITAADVCILLKELLGKPERR